MMSILIGNLKESSKATKDFFRTIFQYQPSKLLSRTNKIVPALPVYKIQKKLKK
jgi:hypothetical protein